MAQEDLPYVEPPPADSPTLAPIFVLPTVPASSTAYIRIRGHVVVDRSGMVDVAAPDAPLPNSIDPAEPAPPKQPAVAPTAEVPVAVRAGTLGAEGSSWTFKDAPIELPDLVLPEHLAGLTAQWAGNTVTGAALVFADRETPADRVYGAMR